MNILKIIALLTIPLGLQAFTIHNRSRLPVVIKQIVIQMHNGQAPYQTMEQIHSIVKPDQNLSLDRRNIVGLQFVFNNNIITLTIPQADNNTSVTLENNNTIIPSEHVIITSQEAITPTNKPLHVGPRLA